jgi:hypothetical protein
MNLGIDFKSSDASSKKKNISLTNTSLADNLNLQKSNLNYIILSKKQTQQINTNGRLAIN